jgi:hypothetical protein
MTSADIRRALTGRPSAVGTLVAAFIIVILVAAPQAQQGPPGYAGGAGPAGSTGAFVPADATEIDLLVGRSTVLNVGSPIARVSLTVPDIADAMVTAPTQLLIHGKQPGTISLFVWDRGGAISTYEVTVRRDLTALAEHMRRLFPGESIAVTGSGTDVVISGTVSSKYVIEKAADVAGGYVEKKENVVNLLKQQEGVASNQVMLRVRFAEVSRSAMQELGATFIANGAGANDQWYGRTAPPGVPSPEFDDGRLVFSDFLNLFLFNSREGLGAAVRALQTKGLFQSLAEPNLVATNGREASFLAGGEYPYPVVQSGTGANSVTIMFKEFGVRLSFTPTVLGGDLVHLKVRPRSARSTSPTRHHRRLPGAGALDPADRDRGRAARRADVRHRRADEQHAEQHDVEDPGHRRHPDPRRAVPQQGLSEEPDRAGRDDHAGTSSARGRWGCRKGCRRSSSRTSARRTGPTRTRMPTPARRGIPRTSRRRTAAVRRRRRPRPRSPSRPPTCTRRRSRLRRPCRWRLPAARRQRPSRSPTRRGRPDRQGRRTRSRGRRGAPRPRRPPSSRSTGRPRRPRPGRSRRRWSERERKGAPPRRSARRKNAPPPRRPPRRRPRKLERAVKRARSGEAEASREEERRGRAEAAPRKTLKRDRAHRRRGRAPQGRAGRLPGRDRENEGWQR